ncbi:MAG: THUMP domain-containing protein [Nitrosopumilaceae archaeon]|nr:THUMP domain-containing protein [Nitrosopumilaceae archaeon]
MNLIITCSRNQEYETRKEMKKILGQCRSNIYKIIITNLSGILIAETDIDPMRVIQKIKNNIITEPWSIRYCARIIPIQDEVATTINDITYAALKLWNVNNKYQYRITIEKRNSTINTKEIISKIAMNISNKVNLKNFDYEISIQIIGERTGISILKPNSILNVLMIKRSISE